VQDEQRGKLTLWTARAWDGCIGTLETPVVVAWSRALPCGSPMMRVADIAAEARGVKQKPYCMFNVVGPGPAVVRIIPPPVVCGPGSFSQGKGNTAYLLAVDDVCISISSGGDLKAIQYVSGELLNNYFGSTRLW